MIEKIQKKATKIPNSLKNFTYEERLRLLSLPSLEFRRFREDLIATFKICKTQFLSDHIFQFKTSPTRGHIWSLFKTRNHTKYTKSSLANRVFEHWNSLPNGIENFSLNQLKAQIDKQFCLQRYGASLVAPSIEAPGSRLDSLQGAC